MKRVAVAVPLVLLLVVGIAFRSELLALGQAAVSATSDQLSTVVHRLEIIRNPKSQTPNPLVASGTIEARTISVGSPSGGKIAKVYAAEGQQVALGDLVAEMDTALVDAELAQARAAKTTAQAQLALQEAGVLEADLAVARAAVAQAQAAVEAAHVAWQDAKALIPAPGELDVAIAQAEGQFQAASEQVTAAQAAATAADLEEALWGRTVKSLEEGFNVELPLPGGGMVHVEPPAVKLNNARLQWNQASQRTWEAHARFNAAVVARDAARQSLADLRAQRANPIELRTQANAAGTAYQVAQAAVGAAQAQVDVLQAGASREQIDAARARVDQAEAAIQALSARRDQARITAPEAGTVTSLVLRDGEVASPGAPIIRLADLDEVTLTAYVPEPDVGQVHLGQPVQVAVDSFPGRLFEGTVIHIADQAEFTPRNVQTREERVNTVFAVKIKLPNPDGTLKPGMPADAYYCGTGTSDCGAPSRQAVLTSESEVNNPQSEILASGTIEATEIRVGAESGGRVITVGAEEGDRVSAGQTLVELDRQELAARLDQANAAVAAAKADLARVTAPPRAERVAQAEAQIKQAEAHVLGAQQALEDARKLRKNPQDLDARINNAQAQVRSAMMAIDLARAQLKAAQVLQESLPGPGSDEDRTRRAVYDQNVAAAAAGLRVAQAQDSSARAVLAALLAIRKNPVALDAAIHRAEGQVAQAQAALAVARATLAQVQTPAQPEAVALAQAQMKQAEAGAGLLNATMDKLTIRSPVTGTVSEQAIHVGEVAQAGQTLFMIVDLKHPKLVIYVPTSRIGQVRLGQAAEVRVDAYPGRVFHGSVTHIADQAEFTPKNVQTQEERVKTVFAVEIALDNEEELLKPGMPADAVLRP